MTTPRILTEKKEGGKSRYSTALTKPKTELCICCANHQLTAHKAGEGKQIEVYLPCLDPDLAKIQVISSVGDSFLFLLFLLPSFLKRCFNPPSFPPGLPFRRTLLREEWMGDLWVILVSYFHW
ncbi:hypothetical protein NPIL_703241 [Nephila pilipes]|uniref:Uncharacterized protein n=1 Tax=Nephila pilipes TaxID=299642 RepID=A0A8X6PNU3_NEPPI|nr:hypothetical protein NPIL_703241 [Nephila pilipes]